MFDGGFNELKMILMSAEICLMSVKISLMGVRICLVTSEYSRLS